MEFKELISIAGYAIETIGVVVIIVGSMISTFRFLSKFRQEPEGFAYMFIGDIALHVTAQLQPMLLCHGP